MAKLIHLLIVCVAVFVTIARADFAGDVLRETNRKRSIHSAPPMTLDSSLNSVAQQWANYLASNNLFQHRPNNKYGENIYKTTVNKGSLNGATPVDNWYSEVKDYNYNNPVFALDTGHFTQLVWVSSKRLGVGIAQGPGGTVVVCNYDPPGNVRGQFKQNVLPPK